MISATEPPAIAIVGMAGRFPGAASINAYWRMLCEGREGIRFFSEDELSQSRTPVEVIRQSNYVAAKGFLEGAEEFDAEFFGLHPRDAQVIDPQQRLLLETCWEALEDAACDPRRFAGLIGVFAGVSMNSWIYELLSNSEMRRTVSGYQLMIANDKDYAATRVSYELDLRGPSIGIQTACSTSLVAVERACQSLIAQECDLALAGAASLAYPRKCGYLHEEGMILSPDGHCRVFDAQAKGTVPGEGVAAVALRRLSDALADRYPIYAVIRGWATNNDGADKIGFTAPSITGQASVIAMAQSFADVPPDAVGYIEAHGTGTPLGDPIEIAALNEVFRAQTSRAQFCHIGSVKSNIGHLDTVAGLAGLIKTALTLQHGQIPPSLHFNQPNPEIDFAHSPFVVASALTPWPRQDRPRYAGVSSFGIGGTNCHLVLEEPPSDVTEIEAECSRTPHRAQLLLVSGATSRAAEEAVERLTQHLRRHSQESLRDVAYTLQVGRQSAEHRRILVSHSHEDALASLASRNPSRLLEGVCSSSRPPVTMLFPGQGVQHPAMVRALYERYAEYRATIDECLEILSPVTRRDLRGALVSASAENHPEIDETAVAQPAIFVASYALARLLAGWGIQPDSMIGHSVGELVAACLAEVMSLPDALHIVARRAELMQSTAPGAMLAVALEDREVEPLLQGRLVVAARNAPRLTVLSGAPAEIDQVERQLAERNVAAWRLRMSRAFHSPFMDPVLDALRQTVARFELRPPKTRFISNVTGDWITEGQATSPVYWTEQVRRTVHFREGIARLADDGPRVFLEVGPGRALQPLVRETLGENASAVVISTLPALQSNHSQDEALLESLGRLWLAGVECNWDAVHRDDPPRRLHLPTYPFQRRSFSITRDEPPRERPAHVVSKQPLSQWFYAPSWVRSERPLIAQTQDGPCTWLVFPDSGGVGEEIVRRLRSNGDRAICVRPGNEFQRHGRDEVTIPPNLFGGYSQLFKEVVPPGAPLDRVLHLWTLTGADASPGFDRAQQLGFYSLMLLAQALGRQPTLGAVQMEIVSDGVQDVTGLEWLCPGKMTVRAPALVAPQEYPNLCCRHIDVEYDDSKGRAWLVEQLLAEFAGPLADSEIAFRGRRRWVRSYQQLPLPQTKPVEVSLPPAHTGANGRGADRLGAWLILGGLGQIGLAVAGWLAMTRRPPLVLLGRSEFPPREAWDDWLSERDADDPTSRRIVGLRQFVAAGCDVQVISADVADIESLRRAAQFALRRYGAIEGIVHSAGVVESRIIHYTSPTDCERQFHAKTRGLHALAAVAEEFHVPLCLVNSSLSSVLGGLGFCAYAASNLYMDAFLQKQNRTSSTRWIGVNWDGWLFPDVAAVMGDDSSVRLTLTPQEGIECLERIAALRHGGQVIISTGDLTERHRLWVRRQEIEQSQESQLSRAPSRHPRPTNITAPYVAPRSEVECAIAEVWEQLLGIDGIGVHDNYLALGGHSLLAGQIVSRLKDRLKVPLSIRSLFEFPTIEKIATHVAAVRLTLGLDSDEPSERIEVEL